MANRMSTLLDRIFAVVPGTTIILSTNTPTSAAYEPIIEQYNSDLTAQVKTRQAAGQKIVLVDCHTPVSVLCLPVASTRNRQSISVLLVGSYGETCAT
jgi:hypothetical protein